MALALLSIGKIARAQSETATLNIKESNRLHQRFVGGRILVKFRDGVSEGRVRGLLAERRARSAGRLSQIGVHVVELPADADEQEFVNAFKSQGEVEYAELDQILSHQSITPNDTYFSFERYLAFIQAPGAWSISTGLSSVSVALVDTGVFGFHPDLQAKLILGWNIFDNGSNTSDVTGQGTWAAGVIAPSSNNGWGVTGICWGCMLMPVRVSDGNGNATVVNIANGITWAADHGAKIANLGYAATDSSTVNSAAQYLWNKGGITVAPSGNNGTFDSSPDNPYILTVGGTDAWTDTIWSLSNTGNNLDLTATNFSSVTTLNGGGYGPDASGTCISAAMVSGVAALVWSVNANLSPAQVRNILEQSADQKSGTQGTWNSTYGWGRVNAFKAVTMAAVGTAKTGTTATLASTINPSTSGQLVTLTAFVSPLAATGSVTFLDGPTTIGSSPVIGGKASFSTASLSIGSHSITAQYGGDTNSNGSTSVPLTQTIQPVGKTATTTNLVSSLNPSMAGQSVTFAAVVSTPSASGMVTFLDGTSTLGSSTLSGGRATLSPSSLTPGSHSITATYNGDTLNNGSSSAILLQTISAKTSTITTLSSSLNPSTSGATVTLTSVIKPSTATGTVTFYDGTTSLGAATLNMGAAALSMSSLGAGSHSIVGVYSGDNNNCSSTSLVMMQTVLSTPPPTAPILISAFTKSATEVDLVWTASSGGMGVGGYQIIRSGFIATTVSGNALSYADTSAYPNTTYTYLIKAYDPSGKVSNPSNSIQVTTPGAAPPVLTSCPAPANNAFSGCYYNNLNLSGNPVFVRTDNQLNFYWGNSSPDKSLTPDNFSVRWQGTFPFNAGTYTFVPVTSDGMRLYIDGNIVLDQWHDQSANAYMFSRTLTQGNHLLVVEYYEHTNGSMASLWWQKN